MSKPRLAIAGGFSGNGGDGGSQTPLDLLIDLMYEKCRSKRCHPISSLHTDENYFWKFLSINLRVEACKKILLNTQPDSLLDKHVAELLAVQKDFPEGYLAMALDEMHIDDFHEWLKPLTMRGEVVRPQFGSPKL